MTFNERLVALQALFVQRAEIDRQLKDLLDEEQQSTAVAPRPLRNAKRPSNGKVPRRSRRHITDETRSEIVKCHREGMTQREIREKFGISMNTVWRITRGGLNQDKATKHRIVPLKDIRGYRCTNCNHTFKSILSKLDAYCPQPTCNKASELEEISPEDVV